MNPVQFSAGQLFFYNNQGQQVKTPEALQPLKERVDELDDTVEVHYYQRFPDTEDYIRVVNLEPRYQDGTVDEDLLVPSMLNPQQDEKTKSLILDTVEDISYGDVVPKGAETFFEPTALREYQIGSRLLDATA